VFRAYDAMLDVWRAVKVLSPRMTKKQKVRERFLNEARTMAQLKHPHIVTVYDVGVDGERVYMVMETLEGGCVIDRVKQLGPLPPRMASAVVQALLSGLGEAHKAGVVHRDVKPHNILISETGVPKLIDFGIAQHADRSLTKTGAVIGTWAYMAPEQRTNAKGVDPRSDLYASGATLYAILTGKDPFDLYATDLHDKLFAGLPLPLINVMKGATRYEPDERYDSAAEMFHALQAAHRELPPDPAGQPPLALPSVPPPPIPELDGFNPLENQTAPTPRLSNPPPSAVSVDSGLLNASEAPTRLVDGVSLHDTGQEEFGFWNADPTEGDGMSIDTDYGDGQLDDSGSGGLVRIALGILLVGMIGLGVGIGAAVMLDGSVTKGTNNDVQVPIDDGTTPETDVERPVVESGIAVEAPPPPPPPPPPEPVKPAGPPTLTIGCSGRTGDAVIMDGVKIGVVPVTIQIGLGNHEFVVDGKQGKVSKTVNVKAGQTKLEVCS